MPKLINSPVDDAKARRRASARAWYQQNKEQRLVQNRAWLAANRDAVEARAKPRRAERKPEQTTRNKAWYAKQGNAKRAKEKAREWKKRNPERVRELERKSMLKCLYGLTLAEFDALATAQKGRCKICKREPKRLHVDHDHVTRKVRGLLCGPCNRGMGLLQDSAAILKAAATYLEENS